MQPPDERVALLAGGEIELIGLLPGASNYTFATIVRNGDARATAVYKPARGERPLWDFPRGTLWRREVAAFEVSEALGWGLVPATVGRDGPHGPGSLQWFVDADPDAHYFTLMPALADVFRLVAAFDIVVNNADRKAGHCVLENDTGRIWAIDHGVSFHADPKLRTVIWDFVGEPLPARVRQDLQRLLRDHAAWDRLRSLLARDEIASLRARVRALLDEGAFPDPPEDRRAFPWPPV